MPRLKTDRKNQGHKALAYGDILVLSGVRGDTRRYRSFHTFEQLGIAGVGCKLSHITDPELPAKVEQASIIILHRITYDRYVERLLQVINRHGSLTIMDVDDLVFDLSAFKWIASPDFQDPVRAALYQEDMQRYQATLKSCHAVIASTHYLEDQVRALNKPVWIHRNAFSLEMLAVSQQAIQRRRSGKPKIVIGYASGTPTHDRDFEVAKPALKHVLHRHPETELWIIGPLDPGKDWGDLGDRIKHRSLVPWRDLPLLLTQFDINIAPLVMDNPFGQSKSEIKYVEAGLVKVPTIASKTNAFEFAIRTGENGFLASNDQEWIDSLIRLTEQADLRQTIGERAHADVLKKYHPAVRSTELVTTLNQIHEHVFASPLWEHPEMVRQKALQMIAKSNTETFWVNPAEERKPSLAQMALYTLRQRGFRTLLYQVWVFFRRLVAPIFPYKKTV